MMAAVVLLALAGLVGLALLIFGYRDLTKANDWAKLLQAVFTLSAFALAAYWYFVERTGMPHADVAQEVHVQPLGDGVVALEAHVRIKNLGQRLLEIKRVQTHVQNVDPSQFRYDQLAGLRGTDYWQAQRPPEAPLKGPQFHNAELRWPVIRKFSGDGLRYEVEPGETDLFVATFLLRCDEVRRARVATDVFKTEDFSSDKAADAKAEQEFAWKTRTFVDLEKGCDPQTKETVDASRPT